MDILNWIYLIKKKLTRTTVQDPQKDLVIIGGNVSYAKRGDKYQSYGMTVEDFAGYSCKEANTYITDIGGGGDNFLIEPSMISGCKTIKLATSLYGTSQLDTYKISGVLQLYPGSPSDIISLGTITWDQPSFFGAAGLSLTGIVAASDGTNWTESNLANGAYVADSVTFGLVSSDFTILPDYSTPGAMDIFLSYDAATTNDIFAYVYFEYEVLVDANAGNVTFTL